MDGIIGTSFWENMTYTYPDAIRIYIVIANLQFHWLVYWRNNHLPRDLKIDFLLIVSTSKSLSSHHWETEQQTNVIN